jgi:protease-4
MKTFFASLLGVLAALFLVFVVGIGLLVGLASWGEDSPEPVRKDSWVVVDLQGVVPDRIPEDGLPDFAALTGGATTGLALNDLLFGFRDMEKDSRVKGVILRTAGLDAGYATLRELRQAIKRLRKAGKKVYAYDEVYSLKQYYLASAADEVWIHPEGLMELSGLGSSRPYFKGFLDKMGVKAELIRGSNNAYKSAGEPFIAEKMSDANRRQTAELLGSIWSTLRADLASDGRLPADGFDVLMNSTPLLRGKEAAGEGLMTRAAYEDIFLQKIKAKDWEDGSLVAFEDYQAPSAQGDEEEGSSLDRLAVVYAEGDIVDGDGMNGVVASKTMVQALRDIRANKRIKAVVLRINSPGGSALASDVMWRELELLRKVKPVVVSMGNLAASGGYYIAAPGERIFAQPTTITGSIGVFGLFFTGEELLRNKVGIRFESVGTHAYSNFGQLDRTLTDSERLLVQANVDQTYGRFLQVVSRGRTMDSLAVDSMAQGRVWSGTDAKRLGLVDAHGGLMEALAYAQKKAGLKGTPRISTYPQEENALEALFAELAQGSASLRQRAEWGPLSDVVTEWKKLQRMEGVQMRMTEVGPF